MIEGYFSPETASSGRALLQFDSGQKISFEEGKLHTSIIGATGMGKSLGVIFPMLFNLIAGGFAGLIIDIKGNMTSRIRALCSYLKRENDVVELGVGPEATPINFLAGLDDAKVYDFFYKLTLRDIGPGHNMSFYQAGIQVATEFVQVLRHLAVHDFRFTPTLQLIANLLSDFPLCAELFKLFISLAKSPKENNLIKQIKSNCFHPCLWVPIGTKKRSDHYDEQAEWRTYSTRNPLQAILQAPGIKRGFCSAENGALDLENLIYNQKKIVVLRFGPRSGLAGEDLTRFCLEEYYKAVFARGLDIPEGEYTFAVMDEFQDFVDFSSYNSLNDNAFVAKSREFNNIFIAAFQSVSSLFERGLRAEKIESFINNCNNRIFMYCDDPWTQTISRRHSIVSLTKLGPGEAVALKFNMLLRKHESGLETLQEAYDIFQARLAAAEAMGPFYADDIARRASKAEAEDPPSDLRLEEALLEWSEKSPPLEPSKTEEEKYKEQRKADQRKAQSEKEIEEALRESELWEPDSDLFSRRRYLDSEDD